jgi:hypothetical protein
MVASCLTGEGRQSPLMIRAKRFPAVFSIVGYLLATTAVQALHDHSGHAHHCRQCHVTSEDGTAADEIGDACCSDTGHDKTEHPLRHRSGPTSCDESCSACRLLAVKCVAPTLFTVVPSVAAVYLVELPARPFFPLQPPSRPLSRGPPCC